jgi:hypothetical protein
MQYCRRIMRTAAYTASSAEATQKRGLENGRDQLIKNEPTQLLMTFMITMVTPEHMPDPMEVTNAVLAPPLSTPENARKSTAEPDATKAHA